MKGLRIIFAEGGAVVDTSNLVADFDATVQNALVNIGTSKGSDDVFPLKGTGLLAAALTGALVDTAAAGHFSNFAAVDTLFFSRTQDYPENLEKLAEVRLTPATFDGKLLRLNAQFTSTLGAVKGITGVLQ